MPTQQDYYGTLGLKRDASADDIRKAYRRLARKHHPDLNPGDKAAEERFKKLQEAYDVLNDPQKKQVFDQHGFYADNIPPNGGGASGAQQHPGGFDFSGFDFSDAFGAAQGRRTRTEQSGGASFGGASFKDLFSQYFSGREEAPTQAPQKGDDLEYALHIDFWQAIRGDQVKMSVQRYEMCPDCRGTGGGSGGQMICPECSGSGNVEQMVGQMRFNIACPRCKGKGKIKNACPACHGDGRLSNTEQIEVRVPAGTPDGARMRVATKGNAGVMGGPAGDLYIEVHVAPHPFFRRTGDNIEIRIPVTVSEAGLGAKIEVPTIDGRALLKIPQGTQNGQKFRMREKGVYSKRKDARGDEIVEVFIQQPDVADERVRELLRELSTKDAADPRGGIWGQVETNG